MANILIKIGTAIILFINLYNPVVVKADTENIKQSFYVITENTNEKSLNENLNLLKENEIPTFVIIDSNENIKKNIIEVLKEFQDENNLGIILENSGNLERSSFVVKGYNTKLKLSGICSIEEHKLIYKGREDIPFELVKIDKDPLKIVSQINMLLEKNENYAIVINEEDFNISTILLANNELKGLPLDTSNYSLDINYSKGMAKIVTYVGNINIILFSISIIIFCAAIVIFRKWSIERFLD